MAGIEKRANQKTLKLSAQKMYRLKPSYVHGDTYRHNTMKLSHPCHKPCQIPSKVCFSVQKLKTEWRWETYFSFFNLTADVDPTKFPGAYSQNQQLRSAICNYLAYRASPTDKNPIFTFFYLCFVPVTLPGNISGSEAAHRVPQLVSYCLLFGAGKVARWQSVAN